MEETSCVFTVVLGVESRKSLSRIVSSGRKNDIGKERQTHERKVEKVTLGANHTLNKW